MTSITQQIYDAMNFLNQERVKQGLPKKKVLGLVEGAQSDAAAIEVVRGLWVDPMKPRFKIFKTCKGMITEFEELLWEDWSEAQKNKRNIKEKIMDRNNHSWDTVKYYLMSRHSGPEKKTKKYRNNLEAAEAQLEREAGEGVDKWT